MPDWRTASRLAALAARRLHVALGVDVSRSVDVFDAIERAGLVLAFFPLEKASGAYVAERDGHPGVLVNSLHPLSRQRYTAAHELGHHVMGHGTLVDPDQPLHRTAQRGASRQEKEAEAFAGWFLMPKPLVERQLTDMGIQRPQEPEELYELALRLGASYEATAWHLVDLKRYSPVQARAMLATKPRQVKLKLAEGQPPDSLRNDVWPLDISASGREITVREGDRIIVRLRERPALGEEWEPTEVPVGLRLEEETVEPPDDLLATAPADRPVGSPLVHTFVLTAAGAEASSLINMVVSNVGDPSTDFTLRLRVEMPKRGVSERLLSIA